MRPSPVALVLGVTAVLAGCLQNSIRDLHADAGDPDCSTPGVDFATFDLACLDGPTTVDCDPLVPATSKLKTSPSARKSAIPVTTAS